ncbi:MAG: methyltransferase domain-containing protein [Acidimicrobiia bacterium]|nr:methyltransferase domain-containing protein [Acidimicrobiia bacterium]
MIRDLPGTIEPAAGDPPPGLASDHPMRTLTRIVAFDPDGWTEQRRRQVVSLFDELADDWSSRDVPGREAPVIDALDRGIASAPPADRRVALDIGAGNGINTRHLAPHLPVLVSVDISFEMVRNAPVGPAMRVQGDASRLPTPDGAVDVLVLANAFLFPAEVERALSPTGVVVWVNSRGTGTPIHLLATEVDAALPGEWAGVASTAGWGTWSVHWRSP